MYQFLILAIFFPVAFGLGRTQSVGVKGVLMCHDQPASNVKVKIYDEDKLSPDELMASGRTDGSGHFELKGDAAEFTSIEPKLKHVL
ncbi:hypothetical protein WR25_12221 [Diploscapter pachys]|uniref:Transthyretin-like family protein n=1 Tax=Diploscapter pachys TaxID=2018661 RepID=A0A2A2KC57_9BILA|nr:hypothetical protein WR25_12221 [Diploscapter pachys]